MKISRFLTYMLFFLTTTGHVSARTLEIGAGKPYSNLQAAAAFAAPGDTLLFYQGVYAGEQYIHSLKGTESDWIFIKAVSSHDVIVQGGSNAWHLIDPAFIHIVGFVFERQTANGVNIDDGGDYETPAHHVVFENCVFRDIDASGNNDLLKLSGVDHFIVERCAFENGAEGGSGIDMVGCHYGEILNSRFINMGSNAVQTKGGSQELIIQANRFENCGQRSLNLGGSTGLDFFRPQDAPFEASEIKVYANVFIGSIAPIAYVGCTLTDAINNTIINPEKWVVRILQESVDPERFIPCGDNSFQNNIIYFSDVSTETNIGPNTRPESFFYDSNLWFHHKNSNWRGPDIPVIDSEQVINRDPLFRSVETQDFSLQSDSPAIGLSFYNGEPRFDFNGMAYSSPRSVGAFEGNPETGLNPRQHLESGFSCDVYPNPFNGVSVFRYSVRFGAHTSLKIYDVTGRLVTELVDEVKEPGQYEIALHLTHLSSGVYLYRLINGSDRLDGKLTLLR